MGPCLQLREGRLPPDGRADRGRARGSRHTVLRPRAGHGQHGTRPGRRRGAGVRRQVRQAAVGGRGRGRMVAAPARRQRAERQCGRHARRRRATRTREGRCMDVSMTLPTMVPHDRDSTLRWCRDIDAGPWASLAVPERVTYPSHDITVELSAAAALTERVRLWSTIVILPAHDAVAVAKQMASIDVLSGGRLTVGVGVGGREHDYRAINARFDRRWQRMDEQVAVMRSIWSGEPPFAGSEPVGPLPVQPGGPPLIAGVMGPKSIARAAYWADGVDG